MISRQTDDSDESLRDREWAWVAGVYRGLPAAPLEEVEREAADVTEAAARSRDRRKAARWLFGIAAAVVLVLLGRWLVVGGLRRPEALASSPSPRVSSPHTTSATNDKDPGPAAPVDSGPNRPGAAVPPRDTGLTAPKAPAESVLPPSPASVAVASPAGAVSDSGAAIGHRDTTTAPPDRPSAVPAEIPGLVDADRVRLRAALGEEGLRSLTTLVLRTTQDGLPGAPLLDRALAGVAHGAPASVILTAVERRAAILRQARAALGSDVTGDVLTAGAIALETGAGPRQLAEVQRRFPPGRVTVGLLALAGLVTEGVPAADAAEALVRGVDLGTSDATLLAWRAGVAADVARGVPPLAALRARVEGAGDKAGSERDARPRDQKSDPVAPGSPVAPPRSP